MAWTDAYIGIPFVPDGRDRAGCDCWGLVCLVYAEQLGLVLPDYAGLLGNAVLGGVPAMRAVARAVAWEGARWIPVDRPCPMDAVLLRGKPYHVGIVRRPGSMLHVDEGISSVVERYDGLMWKHRIMGFYRYGA